MFAGLTLVSCGNDYEYEAAVPESEINPENTQVYFPFDNAAAYTLDFNATSVDVVICRVDSTEEQTVRLHAEGDSLNNVPETVTFAAGATKANVTLTYDAEALGYDNTQKVTIMIADSAQTTAYGMSKYVFNVTLPSPWTSLGMATVVDDIMTAGWGVPYEPFKVEIQENDLTPGLYRLVNPYTSSYPWNEPGDFDDSKDYYLEIHAEDPDAVWFGRTELGLDWGYGMISAWTIADYYVQMETTQNWLRQKDFMAH